MHTLNSEAAFSLTEMMVALALGGFLITGMFETYSSSANGALAQTDMVQMQNEARGAINIMVRDLQQSYGSPTISSALAPNDSISYSRLEDSGYSSGGNNASSLTDTRKSWRANAFAPSPAGAYVVQIVSGTGAGQTQPLSGNTAFTLSLSSAWSTTPDATSQYVVLSSRVLTRTTDNMLRSSAGGRMPAILAANVTSISFALSAPNTISVALTARTARQDPRTQGYAYYRLSSTAVKRN